MRIAALAVTLAATLTFPAARVTARAAGADGPTCDYTSTMMQMESGGRSNVVNKEGYVGLFQFGEAALIDTGYKNRGGQWTGKNGIFSRADFQNNAAVQRQAQAEFMRMQDGYARSNGASRYIGQPIPGCSGATLTADSLRAAVHLVGAGGAKLFLETGGDCRAVRGKAKTYDGNGTCAGKYMCRLAKCTSGPEKDMSKDTCSVTMPMIDAISCENYPTSLQSFCQQALPHRMTHAECRSAEAWARRAPKGPDKEACEDLSFRVGTGSWSYVLACSYLPPAVADGDGRT